MRIVLAASLAALSIFPTSAFASSDVASDLLAEDPQTVELGSVESSVGVEIGTAIQALRGRVVASHGSTVTLSLGLGAGATTREVQLPDGYTAGVGSTIIVVGEPTLAPVFLADSVLPSQG